MDNLRYKYLPKKIEFDRPVKTAVLTSNNRFVNISQHYKKELEKYPAGYLIGYFSNQYKAIFYDENNISFGQFSIPRRGVIIQQEQEIETIFKDNSVRQKRSDFKYDLEFVEEIEINKLKKLLWKPVH